MMPKLVPACQTPATDGTVFVTNSEKVRQARAMVEEDLLIRHPIDCPICDKAGECHLQDYHFEHGRSERRADIKPFTSRRRPVGDTVTLFVDRCVMCSRCVRFTREITGTAELMVVNRGAHEEIDVVPGLSAGQQDVGQRGRPVSGRCPGRYRLFVFATRLVHEAACRRLRRLFAGLLDPRRRESGPHLPAEAARESARQPVVDVRRRTLRLQVRASRRPFDAAQSSTRTAARGRSSGMRSMRRLTARLTQAGPLGVVVSPHLTVEEAYLLCRLARQIDPQALLAVGPIPVDGPGRNVSRGLHDSRRKVSQSARRRGGRESLGRASC